MSDAVEVHLHKPASEIVDPKDRKSKKLTKSSLVGRRPFIRGLIGAIVGGLLASHIPSANTAGASSLPENIPPGSPDIAPEKKTILERKQELERIYGVSLTTARELGIPAAITGGERSSNGSSRPTNPPIEWNMDNLGVLEKTLETKVPKFALEPVNDSPIILALAQEGYNSGEVNNAFCIPESLLTDAGMEQLADLIVHERVHKNNIKTFSAETRTVYSPWYEKTLKIFPGSKYQSAPPEIVAKLRSLSVDLKAPYNSDEYLKGRMKHAFINVFPEELIAVAAELMRGGRERFDRAFGLVLSDSSQIEQLAKFVLEDIYKSS